MLYEASSRVCPKKQGERQSSLLLPHRVPSLFIQASNTLQHRSARSWCTRAFLLVPHNFQSVKRSPGSFKQLHNDSALNHAQFSIAARSASERRAHIKCSTFELQQGDGRWGSVTLTPPRTQSDPEQKRRSRHQQRQSRCSAHVLKPTFCLGWHASPPTERSPNAKRV